MKKIALNKELVDKLMEMDMRVKAIAEACKVQCNDGNWDHDPYMHGYANALIMALATMQGTEPQFLAAPEKWLSGEAVNDALKEGPK